MNWQQVEGNWNSYKGKVRAQWAKLTDGDMDEIAGRRDQLVGRIQRSYGLARDVAEKQVDEFSRRLEEMRH